LQWNAEKIINPRKNKGMEEIKSMGRNNHQAKMAVELEKGADKISGIQIEE